jgi:hypothetical protein
MPTMDLLPTAALLPPLDVQVTWNTHQALSCINCRTYSLLIPMSRRDSGFVGEKAPTARLTGEAEEQALAGQTGEMDSEGSDEE